MESKQWLALKASAGSGKTFALSMRYISLLLSGANPNEILTLTFTKKAAAEMNKRISDNLYTLKCSKNAQALISELEYYGLSPKNIQERIDEVYQSFLSANTKIMTIDAFLNFVLKKFCWYVGVSVNYKIEFEDKEKIYNEFIASLDEKELIDFVDFCIQADLTPQSFLEMITRLDGIDYDFKTQLLEFKNPPKLSHILQEAQEIQNIISSKPQASTRAQNTIKTQNFKELTNNLKWLVEKSEYIYFKKLKLQDLNPRFENLAQNIKLYFDYQEYLMLAQLSKFLDLYKKTKKTISNTLSFDGITQKVYELLQNHFERDFFYFRLDDKITHILIDEFQDTSIMQYKILKPLIEEIYAGKGRFGERSIFFVGDSKQGIYGFRGSNSALFDEASKNIRSQSLKYNYRSSKILIDYVNEVFEPCFENYVKQELPEHKSSFSEGFLEVKHTQDLFKDVFTQLDKLLTHNIPPEKIAILCFNNKDALFLKDYLNTQNPDLLITTEANKTLTSQRESKIILHMINFAKTNLEFHKKSAFKLAGLDFNSQLELPIYNPFRPLEEFILEIMDTFKIYGKSAQKMLEISFGYENLDDFIENIHKVATQEAPDVKNGIQIMTIHKSKGLEFDYVILCDRFSGQSNQKSRFIFDYDKLELTKIFYKQKSRDAIDKIYEEAINKAKTLEEREKINVLYVAFTRAKEGLIILYDREKNAFEKLSLLPDKKGRLEIYPTQSQKETKVIPKIIEQKQFGRQEDFIKQDEDAQAPIQADILFGEALHKALEYELGYQSSPSEVKEILNNQFGYYLPQKSFEKIFGLIKNLKNNAMFNGIISEAWIKSELSYLDSNTLNRIDSIVLDKHQTIIVLDYKSGFKDKQKHKEQVKRYLEFVKTQFDNPIKAYVLYVREKIEFVPIT